MALDNAAFTDLRQYIKRRLSYVRYRVGSTYYNADITDAQILPSGDVRIQASLVPNGAVQINRVEVYNNNGDLWAHQDTDINISQGQTGVLYWFDFTVKEGKLDA